MNPTPILAACLLTITLPAWAEEGHDHSDAPAATTAPALPRFTAESDLFELVGVLNGTHLTLWLDHSADNSPVKNAQLELELGGIKVPVKAHGDGQFEATLDKPLAPGEIPVAATILAGAKSDLLAAGLDIHRKVEAVNAKPLQSWQEVALWAALASALLLGLAGLIRRKQNQRPGGTA